MLSVKHMTRSFIHSFIHLCQFAAGNIGLLVVDFDETCTEKDTIGALLGAAVEANVKVSHTVI